MKRPIALLLILAGLLVAGCGTKQVTVTGANGQATTTTVKNIHFANTKFVFHMGLAFGAFHRYIYKPLKYGELRAGAPHRVRTLAKAALAGAFIVHEVRIAHQDALASDQLRPLLVKVSNLETRVAGMVPSLKQGATSLTAINGVSNVTNSLGAQPAPSASPSTTSPTACSALGRKFAATLKALVRTGSNPSLGGRPAAETSSPPPPGAPLRAKY